MLMTTTLLAGNVLGHPKLGRPESWTLPLVPTDITLLEQIPGLSSIRDEFFSMASGHTFLHGASHKGQQMVSHIINHLYV